MPKKSTAKKEIDDQITPPQDSEKDVEQVQEVKKARAEKRQATQTDVSDEFVNEISRSQNRGKKIAIGGLVALVLLLVGGWWFFLERPSSPEEQEAEALKEVFAAVSERLLLPTDAEVYLASITDAEALMQEQLFFTGSVDGDQLLLFPQLRKAVIWSPSREIIVNVGPIQDGVPSNGQSAQPATTTDAVATTTQQQVSVEVRNGTDKAGYASDAANEVIALGGYEVTAATDASVKGYTDTIVFVNDSAAQAAAERLADTLDATVVRTLPEGEVSTDAAILVVLGADE